MDPVSAGRSLRRVRHGLVETMPFAADLLGRRAELAGVAELLDGPGGGAVVVLGEAGAGKTALLEAAAAQAESRQVRVLRVTGYQAESRYPYAGLHELLMPVLDELARADGGWGRVLRGVLGLDDSPLELADAAAGPAAGPAETDPRGAGPSFAEVGQACQRLLRSVNSRRRTLVVIDDLQWLDAESARALSLLCRRLQPADADLLIAVRGRSAPDELGVRTREYPLAPLAPGDAQKLLRTSATTLRGWALDTVLRRAAGNPLALVEFGRAVAAGAPGQLGIFDDGPLPLPARLEALYSARTRDLAPPARRALLLASAAGTDELADALASGRVAIAPEDWMAGLEAGLIVLDTRRDGTAVPAFVHPLMRSAVFQAASYAEQADAHRMLAAALLTRPERRAWHLAQSVWHPDEDIAAMLEAAARAVAARGGPHAAASAWERAAELSPHPRDACRRLTRAAWEADAADQRLWSLGLAERAVATGSEAGVAAEDLVEAQRLTAKGKVYLGADANLVGDLLGALRTSPMETRFHTAALVAVAATAAYYAPVPEQLAELRAAIGQLPDPFVRPEAWDEPKSADGMLSYVRSAISPFLPGREPLAEHGILDRECVEFNRETGRSMFGAAAYLLDQPELAAQVLEELRRRQPDTVNPTFFALVASNDEMWGRWDEAAERADSVIESATQFGERFNIGFGHITAGMLAVRQGRTEQARRHARAADAAGDGVSRSIPTRTRHLHGLISLTEGDYQTAYTLLRSTLRTDERVPLHFHLSHYAVADFALAAQHTGQQDDAADVLDGLMAHANAMTPGGAHLSRRLRLLHDLARALIADAADATELFQRALSPGAERWPFDQACARLHFGEHLRRRRRIVDARPPLAAALDTFRGLGAAPWAHRAETELRAAGVRPDPDSAPDDRRRPAGATPDPDPEPTYRRRPGGATLDPDPEPNDSRRPSRATPDPDPAPDDRRVAGAFAVLTPQQRAVAELAAQGLTNPQIGARLNISPKTVSIHLSRVFAQLGVTGRAQLRGLAPADDAAQPE